MRSESIVTRNRHLRFGLADSMAGREFWTFFGFILALMICTLGSNCNWNYFQHYEQKRCRAVIGQDGCPARFKCEKLSPEDLKTCVHNGKVYAVGHQIQEVTPCDSCICEVDEYGLAFIECAAVDCPDWEAKNESCYMGYKPDSCCPEEICPSDHKIGGKTCAHNSQVYRIGEFVETSATCKRCICTEKWSGEDGPGCSSVDCLTGIYARQIRRGCLPIYSEDVCCPSELYCDNINGAIPAYVEKDKREQFCYYRGSYYERGSTAHLKNDQHQCVTCRCLTPPDFTCLRKTCPSKPSSDCKTVYGHCCPNYECP